TGFSPFGLFSKLIGCSAIWTLNCWRVRYHLYVLWFQYTAATSTGYWREFDFAWQIQPERSRTRVAQLRLSGCSPKQAHASTDEKNTNATETKPSSQPVGITCQRC